MGLILGLVYWYETEYARTKTQKKDFLKTATTLHFLFIIIISVFSFTFVFSCWCVGYLVLWLPKINYKVKTMFSVSCNSRKGQISSILSHWLWKELKMDYSLSCVNPIAHWLERVVWLSLALKPKESLVECSSCRTLQWPQLKGRCRESDKHYDQIRGTCSLGQWEEKASLSLSAADCCAT